MRTISAIKSLAYDSEVPEMFCSESWNCFFREATKTVNVNGASMKNVFDRDFLQKMLIKF